MKLATFKQKQFLRDLAYQIQSMGGNARDYFKAEENPELTSKEASDWINAAKDALEELKG